MKRSEKLALRSLILGAVGVAALEYFGFSMSWTARLVVGFLFAAAFYRAGLEQESQKAIIDSESINR